VPEHFPRPGCAVDPGVHHESGTEALRRIGERGEEPGLQRSPLDGIHVGHIAMRGPKLGPIGTGQGQRVAGAPRGEHGPHGAVMRAVAPAGVDRLPASQVENGNEQHGTG